MKKPVNKLALKTDKIVNLSKNQAQLIAGGIAPSWAPSMSCQTVCTCH
ncbi:MAG: class I lanthipeptide [Spirosomataceae bacterium]